jgi:hypothetical protein
MAVRPNEMTVSLKSKKTLIALVDSEREKFKQSRSSWIIQSMVEKLERLGYEIKNDIK